MKHALSLLLATVLLFAPASAQTTLTSEITNSNVNPMTQSGVITFITDFGFPTGELAVRTKLDCLNASSVVDAFKSDGMGSFGPKADPASLPTVTAAKVMQTSPTAIQVPSIAGTLRMYCKDKVLYTDFSGAFGKGAVKGRDQLGDGTIDARQLSRAMSGTIEYNVPLYAEKRPSDGIVDTVDLRVALNADTFSTPKSIYDLSIGYLGSNPVVAVFLYDAKKNTLLPLKYGDNSTGIPKARNLPVGDVMEFYFATNFQMPDGWRKVTLDLKHQTVSNVATSKPSGATYVK